MFWMTPEFWLAISFLTFVALVYRKAAGAFLGALDARTDKIRAEIEEVEQLRREAGEALAVCRHRHNEAARDADAIAGSADEQVQRLTRQAAAGLEAAIDIRRQHALTLIARMEREAVAQVRDSIVDVAVATVRELIPGRLTAGNHAALIADSVAELSRQP
jgi:F-type H+-transporting ATPase subunit b